MNRRQFLVGAGLAACGPRGTPPTKPARSDAVSDPMLRATQLAPSPIAFAGDALYEVAGDELRRWDAIPMNRVATFAIASRSFCVAHGSPIIVGMQPGGTFYVVHRLRANADTFTTELGATHPLRVLPGASDDDVFLATEREAIRVRLDGATAREVGRIELPHRHDPMRDHLASTGDGRLIMLRDGLHVIAENGAVRTHALAGAIHLALSTRDRIWYSSGTDGDANVLVHASLDTPAVAIHRFALAPARIVHLATGGGAVALLLFTTIDQWDRDDPAQIPVFPDQPSSPAVRYTVAVIDEASGHERWRVDLAAASASLALNNAGFVAISPTRVVLRGNADMLHAWNAASGVSITTDRPG